MKKSGILLAGIVFATGGSATFAGQAPGHDSGSSGGNQVNVIIINQAPHYGYRQPAPVAIPQRGSLFSTGQIGNYSAVPYPGRDNSPRNSQATQIQQNSRNYDPVRSHSLGTERKVIRLQDLERKVRRPDSRRR